MSLYSQLYFQNKRENNDIIELSETLFDISDLSKLNHEQVLVLCKEYSNI